MDYQCKCGKHLVIDGELQEKEIKKVLQAGDEVIIVICQCGKIYNFQYTGKEILKGAQMKVEKRRR